MFSFTVMWLSQSYFLLQPTSVDDNERWQDGFLERFNIMMLCRIYIKVSISNRYCGNCQDEYIIIMMIKPGFCLP